MNKRSHCVSERSSSASNNHGAKHPYTAESLNERALLYLEQGKYEQAEPLFQRALSIFEAAFRIEHPRTAESVYGLAKLYQRQGKYEQAKALYQRASRYPGTALGATHILTQNIRKDYAAFLRHIERECRLLR